MSERTPDPDPAAVYFFPDRPVSEAEVREMLRSDLVAPRADVVSHLLRYADWDDIWRYTTREEVRELFAELDLPDSLRQAWARMLKIEPVLS